MSVRPEEAQQLLDDIARTERLVRRAVARSALPLTLVLWGIVWILGFGASALLSPSTAGTVWLLLVGPAIALTFGLHGWESRRVRSPAGAKVGLCWLVAAGYIGLVIALISPTGGELGSLVTVLLVMAGYVIQGIWLDRALAVIGLFVTAVAVGAYVVAPHYYAAAMAILGGGALIAGGVWLRRGR